MTSAVFVLKKKLIYYSVLFIVTLLTSVPSPVENVTVDPQSPNTVIVSWPLPARPNGPVDRITYGLQWSAVLPDGRVMRQRTESISYEGDPVFSMTLDHLLPDQTYTIQVRALLLHDLLLLLLLLLLLVLYITFSGTLTYRVYV